MTRVVVFDVDDTLYLERDYVLSGLRAVGAWAERELSVSGISKAAWDLFLAGSRHTLITQAFERAGRPLALEETAAVVNVYREHKPDITLCVDAAALLQRLAGVARVAIVTDGPAVSQRAKIEALGLSGYADPIVITSEHDADWRKPGLPAFQNVQSLLDAEASACTYIADNPSKDFAAPRHLGWTTIRIARPLGLHATLLAGADMIDRTVTTLADLGPNWEYL